jgi:4-amino-4-deoxy-L-arabinose transferase-like glycosyltransferase
LLLLVVAVGGTLRFYNLSERGFWAYDEAFYGNNAAAPILAFKWLAANLGELRSGEVGIGGLIEHLRVRGAPAELAVKPGHTMTLAMGFAVLGISDFSALAVSALIGLMVVPAVFIAGRRWYGNVTALVAATVVAVSGNQVHFSRTAYPQTDTVLLGFLGACLFVWSLDRNGRAQFITLAFAGLAFGLALTMHPSVVLLAAVVVMAEGWRWLRTKSFRSSEGWGRALSLTVPMLVPTLLIEGAMRLVFARIAWTELGLTRPRTFLEWMLGTKVGMVQQSFYPSAEGLLSYVQIFGEMEGPLVCSMALVGGAVLWKKLRRQGSLPDVVVLMGLVVPMVFWSIYGGHRATTRAIQVAVPFLALLAGVGAAWLIPRLTSALGSRRWSNGVFAAFLAATVAWGTWNLSDLLWRISGYSEAAEQTLAYVAEHGGAVTRAHTQLWPVRAFYLGRLVDDMPVHVTERIDLQTDGLQGDFVELHGSRYLDPEASQYLVDMTTGCEPIARVRNSAGTVAVRYASHGGAAFREHLSEAYSSHDDMDWILIYDLRRC